MYQSSKASGSIRLITWPRALGAVAAILLLAAYTSGEPPKATVALAAAHATAMEVEPTDRHRRAARVITEVMDRQHYRQADLDDSLSRQVYDGYLESLDGNRSYLLAADVEEFSVYRDRLDDALRSGDLLPAFAIYARLQQRNRERIAHALQVLETEPDFTLDEEFSFDRSEQPWPATVEELDDLWRKRVKNDALSLRLTGMPWPEIQDTLRKRYQRVLK
ncbi:MAG: tail-specific protease, partial [Steroidobacteraceae bacterium]